jgi:hypothetical protein
LSFLILFTLVILPIFSSSIISPNKLMLIHWKIILSTKAYFGPCCTLDFSCTLHLSTFEDRGGQPFPEVVQNC